MIIPISNILSFSNALLNDKQQTNCGILYLPHTKPLHSGLLPHLVARGIHKDLKQELLSISSELKTPLSGRIFLSQGRGLYKKS